jgi:hypothetical protein
MRPRCFVYCHAPFIRVSGEEALGANRGARRVPGKPASCYTGSRRLDSIAAIVEQESRSMPSFDMLLACCAAIALAGCVSTGTTTTNSFPTTSSGGPAFTSAGPANVAFAEFKNSAFPYRGQVPPDEDHAHARPFLDVVDNGRYGHSSPRNGVLWEDQTYNDRHVLIAASPDFNPNAPGAIVVYFHGNGATLERDVLNRQQTARQVAQSSLNAVLLAPQMAVNAQDSSAGNFWRPGGFAEFLGEAESKLAALYPGSSRYNFQRMPVIIVAYSGGYLPAAYSLEYGGAGDRVRGVVLLDALFGEPEKFAQWVARESPHAFFVSAYSASSREQNLALESRLASAGVQVQNGLPDSLHSGVVAFVDASSASHDDFVTAAWTGDPLSDLLGRMGR